jgi:hypothetical protein
MPLKLNVGLSRKIGEQNYGSRGANVNLEMELESALTAQPDKLQDRIRQLFSLVRASLAEELKNGGNGPNKPAPQNGQTSYPPSNPPRAATQSQLKAIMAIAKRLRINAVQLARDRFQVRRPEDLSIQQASAIIDELKNSPTR